MEEQKYYRGQIYYIRPKNAVGSEQGGGVRPAIIVSNDVANQYSHVVEVVYLTTREKKPLPTHVSIQSAKYPSTALCEQIESVDIERIEKYIGEVTQGEMKGLERAMMISLGISCGLNGSKALETWRKMMESTDFKEEAEDKEEIPKILEEKGDLPAALECIKLTAQKEIYKELYMELLSILTL